LKQLAQRTTVVRAIGDGAASYKVETVARSGDRATTTCETGPQQESGNNNTFVKPFLGQVREPIASSTSPACRRRLFHRLKLYFRGRRI
jgi:hypothetical protein